LNNFYEVYAGKAYMDLKNLRYFVEVAEHGSFLKASSRLHVTQPALSKAVQQLEDELGSTLLIRSRPGVPAQLTPAGELVFQHAKAMLALSAKMLVDVGLLNGMPTGALCLGLPPLGSTDRVAAALTEFRQRFPRVDLRLHEHGGLDLEEAVRKGTVEVAISLRPEENDLAWQPICEESLVAVLPSRLSLAKHSSLTLRDLSREPWIRLQGASILNRRIDRCCEKLGIHGRQETESTNLAFCLSLVAASAGLMILPRLLTLQQLPAGVKTVPLECPDLNWQLVAIWRKDAQLSLAAQKWLDILAIETTRQQFPMALDTRQS
jgi:DNA-binding transcriptional LysR family regulator